MPITTDEKVLLLHTGATASHSWVEILEMQKANAEAALSLARKEEQWARHNARMLSEALRICRGRNIELKRQLTIARAELAESEEAVRHLKAARKERLDKLNVIT